MDTQARTWIPWLIAAQRFDWRIAPGDKLPAGLPVTCRPGVVHGVPKERNQ